MDWKDLNLLILDDRCKGSLLKHILHPLILSRCTDGCIAHARVDAVIGAQLSRQWLVHHARLTWRGTLGFVKGASAPGFSAKAGTHCSLLKINVTCWECERSVFLLFAQALIVLTPSQEHGRNSIAGRPMHAEAARVDVLWNPSLAGRRGI